MGADTVPRTSPSASYTHMYKFPNNAARVHMIRNYNPPSFFAQAGSPQAAAASARQADRLQRWRASGEGQRWAAARGALPICAVRGALLEALERTDVVVVCGETGSGKTRVFRSLSALNPVQNPNGFPF